MSLCDVRRALGIGLGLAMLGFLPACQDDEPPADAVAVGEEPGTGPAPRPEVAPDPTPDAPSARRVSCEERATQFLDFEVPHRPNRLVVAPPGGPVERAAAAHAPQVFGDPTRIDARRRGADEVAEFAKALSDRMGTFGVRERSAQPISGTEAVALDLGGPGPESLAAAFPTTPEPRREALRDIAIQLVCGDAPDDPDDPDGGFAGVVELDWQLGLHATPDDPDFPSQWSLSHVNLEAAWDTTTGNQAVKVAVIDTGVQLDHVDLAPHLDLGTPSADFLDLVDDDDRPQDEARGHGTRVAGILGAVGNNGLGVSGVAWTVTIVPIRAISKTSFASNVQTAIDVAADRGARIVNASWGIPRFSAALRSKVCVTRQDTLFVASAGHGGLDIADDPVYPAAWSQLCPNVIAVAASDADDELHGSSNFSDTLVDLAAPGDRIPSTTACANDQLVDHDEDADTEPVCDRNRSLSGTSAAVPHVAGVAALVWAGEPALSASEVKQAIVDGAPTRLPLLGRVRDGKRLDADGAVN